VLLNYHFGRFVLGSLCVGDLVWLGRKLLMMDILISETRCVHKK